MTRLQAKQSPSFAKGYGRARIEKLKKEINHHRYLYHVLDTQEISDAALDSLKHELGELEKQYPGLITPDSPTQRVGGEPLDRFRKVSHPEPILSLEDIFSFEELEKWEEYMRNYLQKVLKGFSNDEMDEVSPRPYSVRVRNDPSPFPDNNFEYLETYCTGRVRGYFCERKVDGMDIVLTYEKGILQTGVTRGNGMVGEDVTQNIKTIDAIPLRLERDINLTVRGEIFMKNNDFEKLNQVQKKAGKSIFSNPRNVVAGSIRQLDSKVTASRPLDCYVFEIITDIGQKTHQQVHDQLKQLGFKTDSYTKYCKNIGEVEEYYTKQMKARERARFNYDGIVVAVNDVFLEKQLGAIGKSPRWMRAYKFPGKQATTIVEDIIIQVGRTGALTPVAKLKPVTLMGTVISRATLHNEDEIRRLDVRVGDTVVIKKAGDVIPDVISVLKNMREASQKKFVMPKKCTICHSPVKRKPSEAAYYCVNKKCFAIMKRSLSHFVSKPGLDIEGLGSKIIQQLIHNGLIYDASDLFTLKTGDIEPLERFGKKSAENIIFAIENSRDITLSRFLYALGIRHVGEQTAIDFAAYIQRRCPKKSWRTCVSRISLHKLLEISDIGPVVAKSIYEWFHNNDNIILLEKLEKYGVRIISDSVEVGKDVLHGKTFVLTGGLKSMTRSRAKMRIRALGGRVSEAVSKSTDFVAAGKKSGSKYDKAKELGVKIIDEKEFLKMIKNRVIEADKG